jgi:hypothetical protein
MQKLVEGRTSQMLAHMQTYEGSLQRNIPSADSLNASGLFTGIQSKYASLQQKIGSFANGGITAPIKQYIPNVDSLQTALNFLNSEGGKLNIAESKIQEIQNTYQQIQQFQGTMQQAQEAQQFVNSREQLLQSQLSQYSSLGSQLSSINKEAYYAQQQIVQYKEMLHDRQKMEQEVVTLAEQVPAFQDFMNKHSYLAQLFGLPADYGTPQGIVGLQTKAQVQQLITQMMGSTQVSGSNANPGQYLQQRVQQGAQAMDQLKEKLSLLGNSGGTGDVTMPNFQPNSQHTKTFLKRITLGFNVQAQGATTAVPATENIAFTATYKIRDNITADLGGSYILGVGSGGIDHIALTSQGLGLRSGFDIKAKGSIWITGGFEYNYMQAFQKVADLYQVNIWQKSALVGISKKYKIKGSREGTIQLLYDALYNQHIPATQPIVFRTGFSF